MGGYFFFAGSGQFKGQTQKGLDPLEKYLEMPHYVFCPFVGILKIRELYIKVLAGIFLNCPMAIIFLNRPHNSKLHGNQVRLENLHESF
jgi:hypothetical protein